MSVCRICLTESPEKDVSDLEEDNKHYVEIMSFCLDIDLKEDTKISTKLCSKCYKKIVAYYKFKSLAIKNDLYLRTLDKNAVIKIEKLKDDIKIEDSSSDDGIHEDVKIDLETEIDGLYMKEEENKLMFDSDDVVLSVIKQMKYENITDETKENEPVKKKKGRPRKLRKPEIKRDKVCEECGKTVRNLKDHALRHQPVAIRKRYSCKMCDKLFSSTSARHRHYTIKHLGLKKHCDKCNKDVVNLKQHNLVVHETESLPYHCVPCGRRFITQSALDSHTITHTKDRPFECDMCEAKFRTKITMMQHKRQVHEKEKSHLCQFCSKSFFKRYHLQIHLRSHTKEKPYECPDCGKAFSSSTILKNHRMIHSEVKMFGCTLCDMTFCRPGYLRNHMISHTKEKKHPCKYCGVLFGRSDHRKRHEYTAHERHLISVAH